MIMPDTQLDKIAWKLEMMLQGHFWGHVTKAFIHSFSPN